VLLVNLLDFRPPVALSAAIANGAALVGDAGANHVRTMIVVRKAHTLAPILAADTNGNLVNLRALCTGRDKPTTRAPILQVVVVEVEKPMPSKDVSRLSLSGPLPPRQRFRYSLLLHRKPQLSGVGPRGVRSTAGAVFFINNYILLHLYIFVNSYVVQCY